MASWDLLDSDSMMNFKSNRFLAVFTWFSTLHFPYQKHTGAQPVDSFGQSHCLVYTAFLLEIDWYLGFTEISWNIGIGRLADFISLSGCWQNVPDYLRMKAQHSKTRQLSCSNANRCIFINKWTRSTMKHASAVAAETNASSGSFAMLEADCLDRATACKYCGRIISSWNFPRIKFDYN